MMWTASVRYYSPISLISMMVWTAYMRYSLVLFLISMNLIFISHLSRDAFNEMIDIPDMECDMPTFDVLVGGVNVIKI